MRERRAGPRKIPETTILDNINSDVADMLRLLSSFLSLLVSCMERPRVCTRCWMLMTCFREWFLFLLCCRCRQLSCDSLGGLQGRGLLWTSICSCSGDALLWRFQGHIRWCASVRSLRSSSSWMEARQVTSGVFMHA